ncbi:AsmA family protein [Marinomonas transparens]|uniref:AsmA family protein n=1 Tax=Marinomonas transparens TaxID=2795388 RepID=A0A934N1J9_9GAMM|nr:AsmA family protein [Marinomonas transparens]MBJ7537832.1 AsmA family protein [Marinomonas transparens]
MVWIKRLSILIASLLALIVAVLTYVMLFVNPNDFKGELKNVAYEKANVTLRLDGDLSWSFFPWLGLSLENIGVALGEDAEIVQFDRAEFGLAIMPLLKRTIQVDKVKLINLKANLLVDKAGQANWQYTMPADLPVSNSPSNTKINPDASQSSDVVTSQPAPVVSSEDQAPAPLPNIQLDELLIENAQIQYRDEQSKQLVSAKLNVKLKDVTWDKAWPMVLDLAVTQSDLEGNFPLKANMTLNANLTVFPEKEALSLGSLVLSADVESGALPVSPLKAKLSATSMDMDLPQENLFIEGLALSGLGLNLDGKIQAYQVLSDPQFTASFSLGEFNPRDVMKALKITAPEMSDAKALTKAQLDMTIEGSTHSVTAQSISLLLDDTNLEANGVVNLAPLYWDMSLAGSNLNLDRYLPTPVETSEEESNTPAKSTETQSTVNTAASSAVNPAVKSPVESDLIPVDLIRSLSGHVGLVFNNIIVKKLKIDQLTLDSTQANGLVKVDPIKVSLYQGNVVANASLDVRGKTPLIKVQPAITAVQIQPLLVDFMEMDKISGATYLDGEISTRGNQLDMLMSSLQGDLLVDIKKGALVGTNLTKTVCQGIGAVRKEALNDKSFGADTPFETMTFPAHIVNGVVSTPGLKISSAGIAVTGNGVVSLPDASLNYQANVGVAGSELDKACRVNQKVAKLTFPIVCKGKFSDDPAGLCRPDVKGFASLFAKLAKEELKLKADEEKARLKAKLEEEKVQLKAKAEEEKARLKLKIEQEKAELKAKLQAQREAEEEAAKEKLKEKLKDKLKSFF